jgi:outer membrane protein assembly factor BamB
LAVESAVINSPVAYISTVGSGGGFGIYNTNADTGSRNWSIASNYNVFGDFAIAQSAARAGNPLASTANVKLYISAAGKVGIGTLTPGSPLAVAGLPIYANNAAAITGGLSAGDFYRTGANPDAVCVVH